MSEFSIAMKFVLKNEGGYVNHPKDPGGATNFGISLRFLRTLDKKDGDINHDGVIDINDIKEMIIDDAVRLYKKYYWDAYNYGFIENQEIATKVFDICVTMNPSKCHKMFQRAIMATTYVSIDCDGIIGKKTIKAVNGCKVPEELLTIFKDLVADYYRSLKKPEFINGWLNRVYL